MSELHVEISPALQTFYTFLHHFSYVIYTHSKSYYATWYMVYMVCTGGCLVSERSSFLNHSLSGH